MNRVSEQSAHGASEPESTVRAEVVRAGTSLFDRGYAHASAGNISVRLPLGYLITPTDAPLGRLEPQRLSLLDERLAPVSGDQPSKTIVLHHRIYVADPTARAIIHTHSAHLVALSLLGVPHDEVLPPLTPYQVMKVGKVPLVPYHRPGDPVVADLVEATIRRSRAAGHPVRAVLLERLGPVVWGPDLGSALATLEELEETAKVWLLTGRTPEPLSPSALTELRDVFSTALVMACQSTRSQGGGVGRDPLCSKPFNALPAPRFF